MTPRILSILSVMAVAGLLAGCGGDNVESGAGSGTTTGQATTPTATTPATTSADAGEITECLEEKDRPAPERKAQFGKADQVLKAGTDYTIVMKTSCGTLNIALDPKAGGPIPNSIAFLATKGFYDGLTFHRVVPNFVLQGGDPEGNGTGGAGYEVVGPVPQGYQYKLGDVAMAKTQVDPAGTAGSQFFVVSGTDGEQILTAQPVYGILGHAADQASLATIKRIADLAVSDGPPSKAVWIISATVEPAP